MKVADFKKCYYFKLQTSINRNKVIFKVIAFNSL